MRMRNLILAGGLATVIAAGGLAWAADGEGRGKEHRGMMGGQGAEKARGEIAQRMEQRFKEMDANGDGKVTFEEFKAYQEQHMQEIFNRLDRNADGVLSPEDRVAGGDRPDRRRPGNPPAAGNEI